MPFVALYDANALYPNSQRDLLIRIARAGLVQAKWSEQIVGEMVRALARTMPGKPKDKLDRLATLFNDSLADCLVTGYEPLIDGLKLPDPDDRHVLAAAIKAGAQVIVAANLRDFPAGELQPWNVEPKSPDDFVLDQIHISDKVVFACVQQIADSRKRHPSSVRDVLGEPERVWPRSVRRRTPGNLIDNGQLRVVGPQISHHHSCSLPALHCPGHGRARRSWRTQGRVQGRDGRGAGSLGHTRSSRRCPGTAPQRPWRSGDHAGAEAELPELASKLKVAGTGHPSTLLTAEHLNDLERRRTNDRGLGQAPRGTSLAAGPMVIPE